MTMDTINRYTDQHTADESSIHKGGRPRHSYPFSCFAVIVFLDVCNVLLESIR